MNRLLLQTLLFVLCFGIFVPGCSLKSSIDRSTIAIQFDLYAPVPASLVTPFLAVSFETQTSLLPETADPSIALPSM